MPRWHRAKFLNHNNPSGQRQKVWSTVLFQSAIIYRKNIHVMLFSVIFAVPRFVGIQNNLLPCQRVT